MAPTELKELVESLGYDAEKALAPADATAPDAPVKVEKAKPLAGKMLVGIVSKVTDEDFMESFGIGAADRDEFQGRMDRLNVKAKKLFGDAPVADHVDFGRECTDLILWERKRSNLAREAKPGSAPVWTGEPDVKRVAARLASNILVSLGNNVKTDAIIFDMKLVAWMDAAALIPSLAVYLESPNLTYQMLKTLVRPSVKFDNQTLTGSIKPQWIEFLAEHIRTCVNTLENRSDLYPMLREAVESFAYELTLEGKTPQEIEKALADAALKEKTAKKDAKIKSFKAALTDLVIEYGLTANEIVEATTGRLKELERPYVAKQRDPISLWKKAGPKETKALTFTLWTAKRLDVICDLADQCGKMKEEAIAKGWIDSGVTVS